MIAALCLALAPAARVFPAEEATQGVAADRECFYAVANRTIGRYDRTTGRRLARAEFPDLMHLNGGAIVDGLLWCSSSNFPETPMVSSLEVFDPKTLRHVRSVPFGISEGSLVWADRWRDLWYVCFGHYDGKGGEPGRGNDRTTLVAFDREWRRVASWAFPKALISRWDGMTCSGGVFLPDGTILATGHHAPELHRLRLPKMGATLELVEVIPSPCEGQGLAIHGDRLFQIQRRERSVFETPLPTLQRMR